MFCLRLLGFPYNLQRATAFSEMAELRNQDKGPALWGEHRKKIISGGQDQTPRRWASPSPPGAAVSPAQTSATLRSGR